MHAPNLEHFARSMACGCSSRSCPPDHPMWASKRTRAASRHILDCTRAQDLKPGTRDYGTIAPQRTTLKNTFVRIPGPSNSEQRWISKIGAEEPLVRDTVVYLLLHILLQITNLLRSHQPARSGLYTMPDARWRPSILLYQPPEIMAWHRPAGNSYPTNPHSSAVNW